MLPYLTEWFTEIFSPTARWMRHNLTLIEQRRRGCHLLLVLSTHEVVILLSLAHEDRLLGEASLMTLSQHVRLHVDWRVSQALLLMVIHVMVSWRMRTDKASIHCSVVMMNHWSWRRMMVATGVSSCVVVASYVVRRSSNTTLSWPAVMAIMIDHVKKLTWARRWWLRWLHRVLTINRRWPSRIVCCIIEHDHAYRCTISSTACQLTLIQYLLHRVVSIANHIGLIDHKRRPGDILRRVNTMATLGHLRHLDHSKRVHHVVVGGASGETLPDHHVVLVLLLLVDLIVLAYRTTTQVVSLLGYGWFALITDEL